MVKKVILYLLTMIFALSTATALAAEPADAPVSMRERVELRGDKLSDTVKNLWKSIKIRMVG